MDRGQLGRVHHRLQVGTRKRRSLGRPRHPRQGHLSSLVGHGRLSAHLRRLEGIHRTTRRKREERIKKNMKHEYITPLARLSIIHSIGPTHCYRTIRLVHFLEGSTPLVSLTGVRKCLVAAVLPQTWCVRMYTHPRGLSLRRGGGRRVRYHTSQKKKKELSTTR